MYAPLENNLISDLPILVIFLTTRCGRQVKRRTKTKTVRYRHPIGIPTQAPLEVISTGAPEGLFWVEFYLKCY